MTATSTETALYPIVRGAVADALSLDESDIAGETTLLGELGAESIDLLDILFRIERKCGVKLQASDIGEAIQGGIPDEEFGDENEIVSALGLAHLKTVMPQLDTEELTGKLKADQIMTLFTIDNLVAMVAAKATP